MKLFKYEIWGVYPGFPVNVRSNNPFRLNFTKQVQDDLRETAKKYGPFYSDKLKAGLEVDVHLRLNTEEVRYRLNNFFSWKHKVKGVAE